MRWPSLLAVTTVLLLVSGCSSGNAGDPAAMLSGAHDSFASAGSVNFTLSSEDVPEGSDGVSAAEGVGVLDATTPSFEGTITGTLQGVSGAFGVIAIGDEVWTKIFTPDFVPFDLETFGVPNPAKLFDPSTGLPSLLESTTDLAIGEQQRDGNDVLDIVTGKLPGDLVGTLLKLGESGSSFDVTYGITADGELRKAVLTGEFYAGATSTYTFVVEDYGTPVDIVRP